MAQTKKQKSNSKQSPAKAKATMRSFRRAPNPKPFVNFRFTIQTIYWLILTLFVLALGVWVIILTMKTQRIYDRIDTAGYSIYSKSF